MVTGQVHCLQGVSRSVTVVCAYLVATKWMKPGEAIAFIKARRSAACPNAGFRRQLEEYANQCHRRGQTTKDAHN